MTMIQDARFKIQMGIGMLLMFGILIIGFSGTAQAEVNVNINIGPPPVVVSQPSQLILIPRYGIYFVPGIEYDIFFYNGYWWSLRGNIWYRSSQYNGSWVVIQRSYVPSYLFNVPKNYREIYKNERPINYGQWKKQYQNPEGFRQQNQNQPQPQHKKSQGRGKKH